MYQRLVAEDRNGSGAVHVRPSPCLVLPPGRDAIMALRGGFDIASVPTFADTLAALMAGHDGDVIVDLAGVEFIDGSGVGALIRGRNLLRARGHNLTVRSLSPLARRVIEIYQLEDLIDERGSDIV